MRFKIVYIHQLLLDSAASEVYPGQNPVAVDQFSSLFFDGPFKQNVYMNCLKMFKWRLKQLLSQ